jgi:hypothetical protein
MLNRSMQASSIVNAYLKCITKSSATFNFDRVSSLIFL